MITVTVQDSNRTETFTIEPFLGKTTIIKIRAWLMLMRSKINPSDSSANDELLKAIEDNSAQILAMQESKKALDERESDLLRREAVIIAKESDIEGAVAARVANDFRKTIDTLRFEADSNRETIARLQGQLIAANARQQNQNQTRIVQNASVPVSAAFAATIQDAARSIDRQFQPAPTPAPTPAPRRMADSLEID